MILLALLILVTPYPTKIHIPTCWSDQVLKRVTEKFPQINRLEVVEM